MKVYPRVSELESIYSKSVKKCDSSELIKYLEDCIDVISGHLIDNKYYERYPMYYSFINNISVLCGESCIHYDGRIYTLYSDIKTVEKYCFIKECLTSLLSPKPYYHSL